MENEHSNFIKTIMREDLQSGKHDEIVTRFPPEPNGYLHIGHAKAVLTSYSLAHEFGGRFNLRFDDTNPIKEDTKYVEAIKKDLKWLGAEPAAEFFASDMFDYIYEKAVLLIKKGLAYVDDQSPEQIRVGRGTLTEPGVESPFRNRSIEENLALFESMRAGKFENGARVLRAKIDMTSPNINFRDPVIYRILHENHHNTGDKWCIYPMYTFAHPLEDAYEGITHSLCSLEFEDQRPFYDWTVKNCECESVPRQIEFARLNLKNTVMSKRYLKELVDSGVVDGWDDPRMPTIAGLRRRGYTKDAIANFIRESGLSKANSISDPAMLEHFVREDLRLKAPRTMSILRPLKVIITNYPEGEIEYLDAEVNPDVKEMGMRKIPFSREIYIEQEDFMAEPVPKYHRLFPGNEVRLKHAYFIKCTDVIKDADGHVTEIHATYDIETKSGSDFNARKVKGTIHWVDASVNTPATFHLFEPLLVDDKPAKDLPFLERINQNSETILHGFVEENMKDVTADQKFQFFRHGYFNVDGKRSTTSNPSFNHIVSLKSSFRS